MTDFRAFVPFVNRPDLLWKALDSISALKPTIIDNSPDGLNRVPFRVYRPSVPLTSPQTFNLMMRLTKESGGTICIWMHNDAEAAEGVGLELLNIARMYTAQRRKWGFLFTNYDALSAMNTEMFDDIGPWDTTYHQYFCDNDQQRKARLAGWECLDTGLQVSHVGSQTIHSDPLCALQNAATFHLYRDYYIRRWGGEPGSERFTKPFNLDAQNG